MELLHNSIGLMERPEFPARLKIILCNYLSLGQFQLASTIMDDLFRSDPEQLLNLLRQLVLKDLPNDWLFSESVRCRSALSYLILHKCRRLCDTMVAGKGLINDRGLLTHDHFTIEIGGADGRLFRGINGQEQQFRIRIPCHESFGACTTPAGQPCSFGPIRWTSFRIIIELLSQDNSTAIGFAELDIGTAKNQATALLSTPIVWNCEDKSVIHERRQSELPLKLSWQSTKSDSLHGFDLHLEGLVRYEMLLEQLLESEKRQSADLSEIWYSTAPSKDMAARWAAADSEAIKVAFSRSPDMAILLASLHLDRCRNPTNWLCKVLTELLQQHDFLSCCRLLAHPCRSRLDPDPVYDLLMRYFRSPTRLSASRFDEETARIESRMDTESDTRCVYQSLMASSFDKYEGNEPPIFPISAKLFESAVCVTVKDKDPKIGHVPDFFVQFEKADQEDTPRRHLTFWTKYLQLIRVHRLHISEYVVVNALANIDCEQWSCANTLLRPFPCLRFLVVLVAFGTHRQSFQFSLDLFREILVQHIEPNEELPLWLRFERRCRIIEFYIYLISQIDTLDSDDARNNALTQLTEGETYTGSADHRQFMAVGNFIASTAPGLTRLDIIERYRRSHSATTGDVQDQEADALLSNSAVMIIFEGNDSRLSWMARAEFVQSCLQSMRNVEFRLSTLHKLFMSSFARSKLRFLLSFEQFCHLLGLLDSELSVLIDLQPMLSQRAEVLLADLKALLARASNVRSMLGIIPSVEWVVAPTSRLVLSMIKQNQLDLATEFTRLIAQHHRNQPPSRALRTAIIWRRILFGPEVRANDDIELHLGLGSDLSENGKFQLVMDLALTSNEPKNWLEAAHAMVDGLRIHETVRSFIKTALCEREEIPLATPWAVLLDSPGSCELGEANIQGMILEVISEFSSSGIRGLESWIPVVLAFQYLIPESTSWEEFETAVSMTRLLLRPNFDDIEGALADRTSACIRIYLRRLDAMQLYIDANSWTTLAFDQELVRQLASDENWAIGTSNPNIEVVHQFLNAGADDPRVSVDRLLSVAFESICHVDCPRVNMIIQQTLDRILSRDALSLGDRYRCLMLKTDPESTTSNTLRFAKQYGTSQAEHLIRHAIALIDAYCCPPLINLADARTELQRRLTFLDACSGQEISNWMEFLVECDQNPVIVLRQFMNVTGLGMAQNLLELIDDGTIAADTELSAALDECRFAIGVATCFAPDSSVPDHAQGIHMLELVNPEKLLTIRNDLRSMISTDDFFDLISEFIDDRTSSKDKPVQPRRPRSDSDPIQIREYLNGDYDGSDDEWLVDCANQWASRYQWQMQVGVKFPLECISRCQCRDKVGIYCSAIIHSLQSNIELNPTYVEAVVQRLEREFS